MIDFDGLQLKVGGIIRWAHRVARDPESMTRMVVDALLPVITELAAEPADPEQQRAQYAERRRRALEVVKIYVSQGDLRNAARRAAEAIANDAGDPREVDSLAQQVRAWMRAAKSLRPASR